jgi:hypothetical protein
VLGFSFDAVRKQGEAIDLAITGGGARAIRAWAGAGVDAGCFCLPTESDARVWNRGESIDSSNRLLAPPKDANKIKDEPKS